MEKEIVGEGEAGESYGRALITVMRDVLEAIDEGQREVLLETADFWLRLGLVIGVEHADDARQLLALSQAAADVDGELREDAADFLAETRR